MPHRQKKEHADGHQSNKDNHHSEHKTKCKKHQKKHEQKKEIEKHEAEVIHKIAKLEIKNEEENNLNDHVHVVAPGRIYKLQCKGGFVMSGRDIEFKPDHTYAFNDCGSTNCSDCEELTFTADIDINGTWKYDETTRKLTLTATSWRGCQDHGDPIDKEQLGSQIPKVLQIDDWDFSKSSIKIYDVNWNWGHFDGINISLLKCTRYGCTNIK